MGNAQDWTSGKKENMCWEETSEQVECAIGKELRVMTVLVLREIENHSRHCHYERKKMCTLRCSTCVIVGLCVV